VHFTQLRARFFFILLASLKYWLIYIFSLLIFASKSQDKIYFLDGSNRTVKVLEVTPDQIKIKSGNNEEEDIWRGNVLCIEYKNGSVEKISSPKENVVYTPHDDEAEKKLKNEPEIPVHNQISVNTFALSISDISVFYERLTTKNKIGLGLMGAYNFSPRATFFNNRIWPLKDGKKNCDFGAFANIYIDDVFSEETRFYLGIMFKYNNLKYTAAISDSVKIGNVYAVTTKYTPKTGQQFATIFTCGTYTEFSKNFFISTIIGLGGFRMRGDYLQQFNQQAEKHKTTSSILLKAYFGINAGFNF